ncbi:MAG: NAD(P)-dependent oxidoreductase [Prevotella sp.]
MKIAIFGATGIVGKAIVKEALEKGHQVTILTRNAQKVTITHKRLRVVEGHVTDRLTVHRVLDGQEAIIQTLGIGGKGNGKPTTVVSEANNLIMQEMKAIGISRLIAISVIGAGDSLYFLPWFYRKLIMPLLMKWFQAIIDDKNRMETMIQTSGLNWTIVRCTTIKDKPAKRRICSTFDGKGLKFTITAPDMAHFMILQLTDKRYLKKTPTISN